MARDVQDREFRERVRRNVGRIPAAYVPTPDLLVPGRYGTLFDRGELVGAPVPGGDGAPLPVGPVIPGIPQGVIMGIVLSVANATREVGVSDTLPAPCLIRALNITGNLSIADANSFRVLLAGDSDTTATANPTGTDLIEFTGDVVGAEDPGVHAHLSVGTLTVEPWRKILESGQRIKLKVHNISGGVRNIGVYIDLDMLATS